MKFSPCSAPISQFSWSASALPRLALFGSFARDQASDGSDVDILVKFGSPPDWRRYFGAQFYLEDLLGRPVDMAADGEIRAEIRPYMERDAINV